MFYCNDCAKKNEWPETGFKSVGKCECCDNVGECNERASSQLPLPKEEVKKKTPINDIISVINACQFTNDEDRQFVLKTLREWRPFEYQAMIDAYQEGYDAAFNHEESKPKEYYKETYGV